MRRAWRGNKKAAKWQPQSYKKCEYMLVRNKFSSLKIKTIYINTLRGD
ncbi:hypothetical protein HMPREF3197_04752 [Klebsiella pneumoniae]|nr:hypothetical protein HMPREF3197_04752 [Klebsiella pneumoniae]